GGRTRLEFVAVVKHARSSLHQSEMPIHGILVKRNQHIHFIAHAANGPVAGADGQKRVATSNNGLVGVVGVKIQPAARENAREEIPRAGDALTVFTADADCKINCGHRKNQTSARLDNPQAASPETFTKRAYYKQNR